MDPLSVIGGVGAAAGIIVTITKTVKNLSELQAKYSDAEMSIRQMIRQLTTIKASLIQIQDWTELNLSGSPRERELVEAFDISLEGCKEAMESMADEVARLVHDALAGDRRTMRVRYVWNEENVKDHQGRLDSQVQALQLLLHAVQCRTASEQTALLREPKNRQIVQKVADDTSTLRATSSQSFQGRSPSILSYSNSTIGGTEFEMDNDIVNTNVYRRAMAHQRAKSADGRNGRLREDRTPATPVIKLPNAEGDSGFVEGSESLDHLSPIDPRFSRRWERPTPYERSTVSDPADIHRQQRRSNMRITSVSDSFLPALKMPVRRKVVEKKRLFLPSLFTGSSVNLAPTQDSLTPTSGRRRGRRHSDTDIHRSIDLTSTDGCNAPPLVQAAQSGSGLEIEELLDQHVDIEGKHDRTRRTALAVASHCGNDDVVAILLQHGANPNTADVNSMTPLHLAAMRGHYRVVEYLLQNQAHIDALGPDKKTPLRLAADNGHVEVAELLLTHRARVNERDTKNLTTLHSAARLGDEDIIHLLLNYKADIEAKDGNFMAAIHHASERGHDRIVDILLAKKADIEALGRESMSPLTLACSSGSTDVVRLLLQRKASLKHKGDGAMMPLHWASYNGHSDVVDLLLERKVPIDPKTSDGRTPLHLAIMADNFATAELLLRRGAFVEAQCQDTLRPLHYASKGTNTDLIQLLLGHGTAIEAETRLGKRPLHYATHQGNPSIIDLLIRKGASIDIRDGIGDRPLCIACAEGHLEAAKLLLDRGAEPRTRYSKGPSHDDSPLCIAAKNGHLAIVEELVQRGASVRQRDESNWQPLRYAAYFGHPEVVQYLLACGASISGLDNPGSFGFNLTASRIGFAQNAEINEFRRQSVMMLLNDAEVREHESLNSAMRRYPSVRSPQQDFPVEKADDGDRGSNSTYVHQTTPEGQELPVYQRSPRQRAPPPYRNPIVEDKRETSQTTAGSPDNTTASSTPLRPRSPPTASQASRLTLGPLSSSNPQWRPVVDPVPPVPSSSIPVNKLVSPLPSYMRSENLNSPRIVSPLPSWTAGTPATPKSPRQSPVVPQSPTRPPPPVPTIHRSNSNQESTSPHSPPPPTRAAPLPPDLPPIPNPNDAIVVCDNCSASGRMTADLSCEGCRRALYMYHDVMSGSSGLVSVAPDTSPRAGHASPLQTPIYELA